MEQNRIVECRLCHRVVPCPFNYCGSPICSKCNSEERFPIAKKILDVIRNTDRLYCSDADFTYSQQVMNALVLVGLVKRRQDDWGGEYVSVGWEVVKR